MTALSLNRPLIRAETLLEEPDRPRLLVDCRFRLGEPEVGRDAWRRERIPGAPYAHLDECLSGPIVPGRTGRHPLPEQRTMARRFAALGIGAEAEVVFYDDTGGPYAARAWWLACWLGHPAARVLDGGLQAWCDAGGSLDAAPPDAPAPAAPWPDREPLVKAVAVDELAGLIGAPGVRLLDARTRERFEGRNEPVDPVAGHIPGARCAPFTDSLDAAGRFLAPAELQALWGDRVAGDRVICYCGSGVTAAHQVLAVTAAGLPTPTLYAGSWSEWITDPARPLALGPEDG